MKRSPRIYSNQSGIVHVLALVVIAIATIAAFSYLSGVRPGSIFPDRVEDNADDLDLSGIESEGGRIAEYYRDRLVRPQPTRPRVTIIPTVTVPPGSTPIPTPTVVIGPTLTPPPGNMVEPYAGAPECADSLHNDREWHGIWNYQEGCHWDHEHKMNPHDLDDVFGTKVYGWAGGELSYPWQTFSGAGQNFETYTTGKCLENTCKHEGYAWLSFKNRTSAEYVHGALLLGAHTITDARVQYHQVGGQVGALTRFHSVWVEARGCYQEQVSNAQTAGAVTDTCGVYRGGGHLDLGRLNWPQRGIYAPLPGDPAAFADTPAELEPYRIHAVGQNSLDSWQSEGNVYNFLSSDPTGSKRLRVGYGIHFANGESPSETDPNKYTMPHDQTFWCLDAETNVFTCTNNNSAAALFRTWVSIPKSLDGSKYDEDGQANGYFTFHGYTNRYGDIVENCSSVSLDCVPAEAEHFPVGGCTADICKAAYRGGLEGDLFDADIAPVINDRTGEKDWWIEYPN